MSLKLFCPSIHLPTAPLLHLFSLSLVLWHRVLPFSCLLASAFFLSMVCLSISVLHPPHSFSLSAPERFHSLSLSVSQNHTHTHIHNFLKQTQRYFKFHQKRSGVSSVCLLEKRNRKTNLACLASPFCGPGWGPLQTHRKRFALACLTWTGYFSLWFFLSACSLSSGLWTELLGIPESGNPKKSPSG